jgi:long-chain fatty acid transport protein
MRTLIIAVTILAPAAASAGGYVIPNSSPRAIGVSQSAVANESGADALFLNTAALAGQDGLDVGLGGEVLLNQTEWSDPNLGKAKLGGVSTPPAAAVAYGARLDNGMAWGAGIGFGVPAGGSLKWPTGWAGQESIQSVNQMVFAIGGGVAFQPLPFLKLGATYLRFQAVEELHLAINYLDHFGDAGISLSGGANSFGLAAEVQVPTLPLSFGVTYSHSADLSLSGNAHFDAVPASLQSQLEDQAITEQLKIPNVVFAGAAYEVIPNLKAMAAVSYERWSLYKEDKFVGALGFMTTVPRNYKDAYVYRLGGEWVKTPFLPALTLRAGLQRSMSDQPTDTVSPSLTDGNSTGFAVGAGYNFSDAIRVDLGAQFVVFDKVTATGTEAFPGSYNTTVEFFSFGVNWRTDLGMSGGHGK